MKAWKSVLVLAVAGGALLGGCEEQGPCCFVDLTSHAVVLGIVESSAGTPASHARLEPIGVLRYECDRNTNPVWARGDSAAVADADGLVMLVIYTADGPGNHCVDLVAKDEAGVEADTIRDVELEFRLLEEVPDTVEVQVVLTN